MKRIIIFLIVIVAGVYSLNAQTTFSNTNAVTIPDDNTTGAYSSINVTGINPVSQVVSVQVDISHTYDGDLTIILEFYNSSWTLSSNNGGSGDNYQNTVFTNTATTSITAGTAPFNGTFLPEQSLPTFNEAFNPNGTWVLHVIDGASGDVGTINSWSITFDTPPCDDLDFTGLPATEPCNDGRDTLVASSVSGDGYTYPALFFEFNIDADNESTSDNTVTITEQCGSNTWTVYSGTVTTDRLTVYPSGPLYSPSCTYTFTATDNDGSMSWLVYDRNGNYWSGSFANTTTTEGPFTVDGISTWDCTPTNGITWQGDYGMALFYPSVVGPGTYTITYTWDNEGSGNLHCTGSVSKTVVITNPWDASWNPPDTVCSTDAPLTLSNYVTGDAGGSFNGQGVTNGVFYPANVSGTATITYSVGSSSACFSSEQHTIYVVPHPTADAGQDFGVCGLDVVQLNGSATDYSSVEWTLLNGTGTLTDENTLTPTYTPGAADITHTISFVLTAYDGNYCSAAKDTVSVTFYEEPTASATTVDVTSCINPDGEIHVSATGGETPYQYSIDGGLNFQSSGDFGGLMAGNYTVVVMDGHYCTDTLHNVVVNNSTGPNIDSVVVTDVTCPGAADGTLTIYATGSNLVYSIDSANSYSSQNSYSNLNGGTYYVFVSDGGGCQATSTVQINEPAPFNIDFSVTPVSCNGQCDGAVDANVTGGTAPYTYAWSNGESTSTVNNLCAGDYVLTVTDAHSCTASDTVSLTAPPAMNVSYEVNAGNCNEDGATVSLTVTGGTEPYTYLWSNGNNTSSETFYQAGYYSVTVTDANDCEVVLDSIEVNLPDPLVITEDSIVVASCVGSNDGAIYITVNGGTGNYDYLWSNESTTEDLTDIATGNYAVTVTDENGCTATASFDVGTGNGGVVVSHRVWTDDNHLANIDLTVEGGTPPYTYSWSNGATTEDLNGIDHSATFMVTVTDANGCLGFDTISVSPELYIATVITPNGDGKNDTWKIVGLDKYQNVTLEVYNRWGDMVFKFEGSGIEYMSPENQWDGTGKSGKLLPFGSYLYIVNVGDEVYKGTIVIK